LETKNEEQNHLRGLFIEASSVLLLHRRVIELLLFLHPSGVPLRRLPSTGSPRFNYGMNFSTKQKTMLTLISTSKKRILS